MCAEIEGILGKKSNTGSLVLTCCDVQEKNSLEVRGNKTFYSPLWKRGKDEKKDPMFIKCVLKLRGYLESPKKPNKGSWVLTCCDVQHKNSFEVRGSRTFYSPLWKRGKDEKEDPMFIECVLKLRGYLENPRRIQIRVPGF